MSTSSTKINSTNNTQNIIAPNSWMLLNNSDASLLVPSTIKPLVNGERAFGELYQRIEHAKQSVDIAIWGFQPSMFFKRGEHSSCIGELLLRKILENDDFKVRLLVWKLPGMLQTFTDANIGNHPDIPSFLWFKRNEVGVTQQQQRYDRLWYEAIRGNIATDEEIADASAFFQWFNKKAVINKDELGNIFDAALLREFNRSPKRKNLQLKFRTVDNSGINKEDKDLNRHSSINNENKDLNRHSSINNENKDLNRRSSINYEDKDLNLLSKVILKFTPSHHQKSVLIDYEDPNNAIGFILEHNMVDNYWDTDAHSVEVKPPEQGKNALGNLQDVSSLVTGEVLYYINKNFCQSWDRKDSEIWNLTKAEAEKPLTPQRSHIQACDFKPKVALGVKVKAQILRTYDNPKVEDIKAMYLQNIKNVTSYIYTENQYFRFPPLVESFVEYWQRVKDFGREEPIHWFVVTNDSDGGVGRSADSTYRMLKALGKGEQLPKIMRHTGEVSEQDKANAYQQELSRLSDNLLKKQQALQRGGYQNTDQAMTDVEKLKQAKQQIEQLQQQQAQQELENAYEIFSNAIGIKAHICTLVAMDSPPDDWQPVYIHSKVTIINDVFLCISSANLNTRSMQIDTELGIITEAKPVAQPLRKTLWGLHTNHNSEANPEDLTNYKNAQGAFKKWGDLIKLNKDCKDKNHQPMQPLCEFYNNTLTRFTPTLD